MKWMIIVLCLFGFSCGNRNKTALDHDSLSVRDSFQIDSLGIFSKHHADSIHDVYTTDLIRRESFDSISFFDARLIEDEEGVTLAYKKNSTWKKVSLDDESVPSQKNTSMDTIQLNGKGNPELILRVEQWSEHSYYPNPGGWAFYYSDWYVYDIDNDTLLFHAEDTDTGGGYGTVEDSIETANSSYEYHIHFSPNRIMIDSLSAGENKKPDHEPGTYIFSNGKFVHSRN